VLLKILKFPYNISATAGASDFKFGKPLQFFKAHHIIARRRKGVHGPKLGSSPNLGGFPSVFAQRLKLATSNLVHSFGLPRPIIKSHSEENVGVALG